MELFKAFRVTGRVIVRESQIGIPNVLVTLYDLTSIPNNQRASNHQKSNLESRGLRLGSVVTNNHGQFNIIYHPEYDKEKSNPRRDILLTVCPPEEGTIRNEEQNRNLAISIRNNAARVETFLISVEKKKLESIGVNLQDRMDRAGKLLLERHTSREYRTHINEESRKFVTERLLKMHENNKLVNAKFNKFLSCISAIPDGQNLLLDSRYIKHGTSVVSANTKVIKNNIETRVNMATLTTSVMLSDSQIGHFTDATGAFLSEAPSSKIESAFRPPNNSRGPGLVALAPSLMKCYEKPKDPCTAMLDETESEDEIHDHESQVILNIAARTNDSSATPISELSVSISDSSGMIVDGYTPLSQKVNNGTLLTVVARDNGQYSFARWEDSSTDRTRTITPSSGTTQLLAYYNINSESSIENGVNDMLKYMTSPDSSTIFRVPNRAGIDDIQNGINSFTLHSGPADVPAFYDFHVLKIAFENVWQELFDDDIIKQGKDLYTKLVELGIDPNEYLLSLGETDIGGIDVFTMMTLINNVLDSVDEAEAEAVQTVIPSSITLEFAITQEIWSWLSIEDQQNLLTIAEEITKKEEELGTIIGQKEAELMDDEVADEDVIAAWDPVIKEVIKKIDTLRKQGETIIISARPKTKTETPEDVFGKYSKVIKDLGKTLRESYRFSIYGANGKERSINFGIISTYRQKWEPINYQVGQLIKTIPLAPKEVRRYSKKVTVKKSRAEKEVENNLHSRKTESSETTRAEKEIVQKALTKTNFKIAAEGGVNVAIANAKASSEFMKESSVESQEVKKEFRESVFKAAEEYKSERTVEINVSTGEEVSFEESGEISNPNDEIAVTYLFYELQRRFRLREHLHQVMPVVLVAQEFPKPSDIDEDWIIANDWILRRVILDDSFLPALNYVTSKVIGDEYSLQEMYSNIQQQRLVIQSIQAEIVETKKQLASRYSALESSIENRAQAIEAEEDDGGLLGATIETTFGGSSASPEAMQAREDAARDAYDRVVKQEKELQERLSREVTALNALTETYTKELSDHLNRRAQIARLKIHIKNNIMYYMQAIWSHEPPDERFFRLHEVPVPKLTGKLTYKLEPDPDAVPEPPTWTKPLKLIVKCKLDPNFGYQTLEAVADLDNLLGYKGNYMMFPLKESNVLTDFMMTPYYDPTTIIRDPDPLAQWTMAEFSEYVCCLYHSLSRRIFERYIPGLREVYRKLINASDPEGDDIIVPTGSLFIEALPGVHPILEDFKLMHRIIDVKKVQGEVRTIELENIRLAARLLAGEREDPTIEKKIVVEGGNTDIVEPNG